MNLRSFGLFILGLCIVGGLIAGLFSRSIEAALTLPASTNAHAAPMHMQPAAKATAKPMPMMPGMPTQPPGGVTLIAHDTFQRTNQQLWGTASDGQQWAGDANTLKVFSITNNAGQIAQGQGTFNAVLGPNNMNAEIVFGGTVSRFADDGTINLGGVLRWTDSNNWYKILIDGTNLQLLKRVNATSTVLMTVPFKAQAGVSYMLRFRALGAGLFARAWPANQPEPASWMIFVTDTSLTSGFAGIRVLTQNDVVIRVTSFMETTVPNVS
jgi:hypothetical protein